MASILLIEDDVVIRQMIEAMLAMGGHTVLQAGDGSEGVKLYRRHHPDLVVTDIVMPEKEGLSTIQELRRINPEVRIIAMSGGLAYDPQLYLNIAARLGANRVLKKPFQAADLQKTVAEVLTEPPSPAS